MADFLEKRKELIFFLLSAVLLALAVSYLGAVLYEETHGQWSIWAIIIVGLFGTGIFYAGLRPYAQKQVRIRGLIVFHRLGDFRFSVHLLSPSGWRGPLESLLCRMFARAWDNAKIAEGRLFGAEDVKEILEVALLFSLLRAFFSGIKNYLGEKNQPIDFSQIQAEFRDNEYLYSIQDLCPYSCLPSGARLHRMEKGQICLRGNLIKFEARIMTMTTQWPWLTLLDPDYYLQPEWLFGRATGKETPKRFVPLRFQIEMKSHVTSLGFLALGRTIRNYWNWVENIFQTVEHDFDLEKFLEDLERAEKFKRWLFSFREEASCLEALLQTLKDFLEKPKGRDTKDESEAE